MRRPGLFIAIIILLFVVVAVVPRKSAHPITETETRLGSRPLRRESYSLPQESIAYSARHAVRHFLKSRSSVVFPPWPDDSYRISDLSNNTYTVTGTVTAKNAFGVTLQERWFARLIFTGRNLETARTLFIKVGDEVLYNASQQ